MKRWIVLTIDGMKFDADEEPREDGAYLVVVMAGKLYRIPHQRVRLQTESEER